MLALTISDYLYPAWQLPMIALLIAVWLIGGSLLLRRSLRPIDHRVKLGKCLLWIFLAGCIAALAGGVLALAVYKIAQAGSGTITVSLGTYITSGAVGFVAAIVAVFLFIYAMLNLPFKQSLAISWKPVSLMMATALVVAIGCIVPAYWLRLGDGAKTLCLRDHLSPIYQVLVTYDSKHTTPIASLKELEDSNAITPDILRCPGKPQREIGYFYFPRRTEAHFQNIPSNKILMCDFKGNHRGGRNVLMTDGMAQWYEEGAFGDMLNKPENKAFAEALKEAEQKAGY